MVPRRNLVLVNQIIIWLAGASFCLKGGEKMNIIDNLEAYKKIGSDTMAKIFGYSELSIVSKRGWIIAIGIGFLISTADKYRHKRSYTDNMTGP